MVARRDRPARRHAHVHQLLVVRRALRARRISGILPDRREGVEDMFAMTTGGEDTACRLITGGEAW